ncbi:PQQ-dependent sugar dehydrogenase [Psychrobacter sp. M13]|uniref:PQQ-dependent sugar dehydrogenase n=1 Tax=Psychrobacter sp. M13 TaxID=3067275 RepID=UPI00273CDE2E|nr:PQQ-dependent sugar dehydrogenase [Psychrobacter sp. M13]WLP93632.1 PQQ-dependent sugar dehydrogenase [Psychrobacter sp. M13]
MITPKLISVPLALPLALPLAVMALLFSTAACSDSSTDTTLTETRSVKTSDQSDKSSQVADQVNDKKPSFTTRAIATFDEPWAMTALPKQDDSPPKLLVTQKTGELFIVDTESGIKTAVSAVPKVAYGGQGGLGDIILAPDFAATNRVYLSYVEAGEGSDSNIFGAKVISAKLMGLNSNSPSLTAIVPIWQQTPKVKGQGHYSHRLLFSTDGKYLYISSGDRQKQDPAQDMSVNLGKIIRLSPDGSVPMDNPFFDNDSKVAQQFWTLGNRNVLGMAFDDSGRLWANEMGPRGGDELNLIEKGSNYGWPVVSNGRNYSGIDIPDHDTQPDFTAPKISWTPVISPSSMSIYRSGIYNDFPAWQSNALVSGLSSQALIVVDLKGLNASERYRYDMGKRMRNVLVVEGQVWALEDGNGGKLLKLLPN